MPTIKVIKVKTRSKAEFKGKLRKFTSELLGKRQATSGPAAYFWAAFAHSIFKSIHKGFMDKSDGRKDDLGYSWKPLKKSTIAARPLLPGEKKKLGILKLGLGGRGLLTAAENRIWKGIFASNLEKLLGRGVPFEKAKIIAAKMAWGILKARGAQTKLEVLGNRKVPILIDTHELEKSLRPSAAKSDSYTPQPSQIFRVSQGQATVGTEVKHAKHVHKTRPLWGGRITPWIKKAVSEARDNVVENFERAITQ